MSSPGHIHRKIMLDHRREPMSDVQDKDLTFRPSHGIVINSIHCNTMHLTTYLAMASTAHVSLSLTVPAEPPTMTYACNPADSISNVATCISTEGSPQFLGRTAAGIGGPQQND